jgi:hypothetical protein
MVGTDKRTRITQFYGFIRILPMICRRIFEDRKSDHRIAEEEQEVLMD